MKIRKRFKLVRMGEMDFRRMAEWNIEGGNGKRIEDERTKEK